MIENSRGSISRGAVKSLSIASIRNGGAEEIAKQLMDFPRGSVVVVNAAAVEDIDVVILGLLEAARQGKKLFFRIGAAFVSSRQ